MNSNKIHDYIHKTHEMVHMIYSIAKYMYEIYIIYTTNACN